MLKAKILKTVAERATGVIGKDKLDDDEVYIFVNTFPHSQFHMKGVKFPIEIAFTDNQFEVLAINRMDPETGTAIAPNNTAYAVEANVDFFNKKGIKVGDFWKELSNKLMIQS